MLFHWGVYILHAKLLFSRVNSRLYQVFLLQCFLCFVVANIYPLGSLEMYGDIGHTVLAIKKLDAKRWTRWRMVELAFHGIGCTNLWAGPSLSVGDTGIRSEL